MHYHGEKTSAGRGLLGESMGIETRNMVGRLTTLYQDHKEVQTRFQTCVPCSGKTKYVDKMDALGVLPLHQVLKILGE